MHGNLLKYLTLKTMQKPNNKGLVLYLTSVFKGLDTEARKAVLNSLSANFSTPKLNMPNPFPLASNNLNQDDWDNISKGIMLKVASDVVNPSPSLPITVNLGDADFERKTLDLIADAFISAAMDIGDDDDDEDESLSSEDISNDPALSQAAQQIDRSIASNPELRQSIDTVSSETTGVVDQAQQDGEDLPKIRGMRAAMRRLKSGKKLSAGRRRRLTRRAKRKGVDISKIINSSTETGDSSVSTLFQLPFNDVSHRLLSHKSNLKLMAPSALMTRRRDKTEFDDAFIGFAGISAELLKDAVKGIFTSAGSYYGDRVWDWVSNTLGIPTKDQAEEKKKFVKAVNDEKMKLRFTEEGQIYQLNYNQLFDYYYSSLLPKINFDMSLTNVFYKFGNNFQKTKSGMSRYQPYSFTGDKAVTNKGWTKIVSKSGTYYFPFPSEVGVLNDGLKVYNYLKELGLSSDSQFMSDYYKSLYPNTTLGLTWSGITIDANGSAAMKPFFAVLKTASKALVTFATDEVPQLARGGSSLLKKADLSASDVMPLLKAGKPIATAIQDVLKTKNDRAFNDKIDKDRTTQNLLDEQKKRDHEREVEKLKLQNSKNESKNDVKDEEKESKFDKTDKNESNNTKPDISRADDGAVLVTPYGLAVRGSGNSALAAFYNAGRKLEDANFVMKFRYPGQPIVDLPKFGDVYPETKPDFGFLGGLAKKALKKFGGPLLRKLANTPFGQKLLSKLPPALRGVVTGFLRDPGKVKDIIDRIKEIGEKLSTLRQSWELINGKMKTGSIDVSDPDVVLAFKTVNSVISAVYSIVSTVTSDVTMGDVISRGIGDEFGDPMLDLKTLSI